MFTPHAAQGGRGSQIWSVDVTGRNERRVHDPRRRLRSGLVALDPVGGYIS